LADPLPWTCRNNHDFNLAPWFIVHRDRWCPQREPMVRYTLSAMAEIVRARGGRLLTTEVRNRRDVLDILCEKAVRSVYRLFRVRGLIC
jgi:hypothetical protein